MEKNFPCIKCGLCCYKVGEVEAMKFFLDDERGCCKYLDEMTKMCTIYNERPLLCSVSSMYDIFFSSNMREEEFIQLNLSVCYQLNEEWGYHENCQRLQEYMK